MKADVIVLLINNLIDAVVKHTESNGAFSGADCLGRSGATLGVLSDVLVEINKVLNALVMTILLNDRIDNQLCGTGGIVVGRPNKTLVLGIGEVFVILRRINLEALKLVLVVHDSQDTLVNAVPVIISALELIGNKVRGILWLVLLKQAL